MAFLGIYVEVSETTQKVDIYASKGCYPDIDNRYYDIHFSSTYISSPVIPLTYDCIDYGKEEVWFVIVRCNDPANNCKFTIQTQIERLQKLTLQEDALISITNPSNYFMFETLEHGYTITLSAPERIELVLYMEYGFCPSPKKLMGWSTYTQPTVFEAGSAKIVKYSYYSQKSAPGPYFLRVDYSDYSPEFVPTGEVDYTVMVSNGYCNGHCAFGRCTEESLCSCFPGYNGYNCEYSESSNFHTSFSSFRGDDDDHVHYIPGTSRVYIEEITTSSEDVKSSGSSGFVLFGTVISFAVIAYVLLILVIVVAIAIMIRRKMRRPEVI